MKNKFGLVLAALLGLSDLLGPFVPSPDADAATNGPPFAVLVAGAVLGVITFFVAGTPSVVVAIAAAGVLLTIISVVLVLARPREMATTASHN